MATSACLLFLLPACGDAGQGAPTLPARGPKPIVGVILPDRTTSARWEEQDRPLLTQAFNYADIEPFMENAEGDEAKFAQIADEMIRRKVKVLMITPLSAAGGLAVQKKAKAAGRRQRRDHQDLHLATDHLVGDLGELRLVAFGVLHERFDVRVVERL